MIEVLKHRIFYVKIYVGTKEHHHSKGVVKMEKYGLKVAGHKGTWYVIDESFAETHMGIYRIISGTEKVYLLEHEKYGDEAPCIIVDGNLKVIMDDVYNGFRDLAEHCEVV